MVRVLDFPFWLALVIAIVIECLGLATVSTILSFWSYNRRYTDERKQAPIGLTIVAFTFYLLIVLAMNVAIDATAAYDLSNGTNSSGIAEIIVRALLTLMSIPAALIMAVRTQHQEVLNDGADSKRERAFKKHYGENWFEMMYGKPAELQELKVSESFNKSWRSARKTLTAEDVLFIQTRPIPEIMEKYNLIERTAYNWQEYAKREQ